MKPKQAKVTKLLIMCSRISTHTKKENPNKTNKQVEPERHDIKCKSPITLPLFSHQMEPIFSDKEKVSSSLSALIFLFLSGF